MVSTQNFDISHTSSESYPAPISKDSLSPCVYKAAKVLTVQRQAVILSIGLDGAVEKNMPPNHRIKTILWLKIAM